MKELIKKDMEELRDIIQKSMQLHYGLEGFKLIKDIQIVDDYIFVFGKEVACRGQYQGHKYRIKFYIHWCDSNNFSHINDLIDKFILDHRRLG